MMESRQELELLRRLGRVGRQMRGAEHVDDVPWEVETEELLEELGEGRLWHSISAGVKAAKRTPAYAAVLDGADGTDDEGDDDRDHIVTKSADRAGGDELDD